MFNSQLFQRFSFLFESLLVLVRKLNLNFKIPVLSQLSWVCVENNYSILNQLRYSNLHLILFPTSTTSSIIITYNETELSSLSLAKLLDCYKPAILWNLSVLHPFILQGNPKTTHVSALHPYNLEFTCILHRICYI